MLASLRRGLNTWPARVFFLVLVGVFVLWGVGDVIRNVSHDSAVATVGGRKIELPELQDAYRRQMQQVQRMMGGRTETTPDIRRGVAEQALGRLVTQVALTDAATAMGLVAPDAALRDATWSLPAFRGPDGKFDRAVFERTLRDNGLTEQHFLALLRQDLLQRQLLEPVRAGAVSPDLLTRQVYAFQHETRIADAVDLPFAAAAAPAAPNEAQLTRWYDNHKDQYSTPEYRRIKAVILSPETVAKEITVTDEDLRGAYEQARASYIVPEKRSAEVVLLADEAKARALAASWLAGADWPAVQADAAKQGGSPVDLAESTRDQIPSAELADALFSAPQGVVGAPVKTPLGWYVLKVTAIAPGSTKTLNDVRDEVRTRVIADKAADLIYDRANKVEDLLAGGVTLDTLPSDLGLVGVAGTMDAQGKTPSGQEAPIPGAPELRAAIIQAAFQAAGKGEPSHLSQVPAEGSPQAFFAVAVEDITPPAPRPFAEVDAAVRADWTKDAIRHAQEEAAAKLLAAVKGGQTLADAAAAARLTVQQLPPAGRAAPVEGVPAQLVRPLFTLKPGEPTMVETADGFVVAVLAKVVEADPAADPVGFGQVRDALAHSVANDMEMVFASALRARARPTVNRAMLDSVAQPE